MRLSTLGSYHRRNKRKNADKYGSWDNGRQVRADVIAGRTITYDHREGTWTGMVPRTKMASHTVRITHG